MRTRLRKPVIKAAAGVRLPSQDPQIYKNAELGQQAGQVVQQAGQVASSLSSLSGLFGGGAAAAGAAGGAAGAAGAAGGLAGVAGAAGPIGAALAVGAAADGMINKATTDEDGFAKTSNGATVARNLGSALNPIGTIMGGFSNLKNDDMTTLEKVGSFIPGLAGVAMRNSVKKKRERFLADRERDNVRTALTDSQAASYGGLTYAKKGAELPVLADGGPAPKPRPKGNTALPSPQDYYSQVLPTIGKLLGQKHDETYVDPQTGKTCTANSCLSFATTVLEQATGTSQDRTKANLYNPEFTRTSEEQGWTRIPLKDMKAGDRLQYWAAEGSVPNGVDRSADLGGRNYIQGKYPAHMMVFGGWKDDSDAQGRRNAVIYNDGHEFENANREIRPLVGDDAYVGYRYVGAPQRTQTEPKRTQNLATRTQLTPRRKLGGLVPEQGAPSQQPLAKPFEGQKEQQYQNWVARLPAGHRESIDPKTGNGRDYDYRRAFSEGVEASGNGHFTDRYKLPNHRTFSNESLYFNPSTRNQAGKWEPTQDGGNRWVPFDPKTKHEFREDKNGRPVPGYATGGTMPASVIASGSLHSEKHDLSDKFKKELTPKGIPIIGLHESEEHNGRQVAELERDELTMSRELTDEVQKLHKKGDHEKLGRVVAEQIKTNTYPSARYRRRLKEGGTLQPLTQGSGEHNMAMLGEDGTPQMWLRGKELIFSRSDTRETVTGSLKATTAADYRNLGRSISTMIRRQKQAKRD